MFKANNFKNLRHRGYSKNTYQREAVFLWLKDIAWFALDHHAACGLAILYRTHEELVMTKPVGKDQSKNHCCESTSDEALPGLLRTKLNQRCPAEEEPKHVRHHVVADDHRNGHDEPNQSFENVLNNQVTLGDHNQQSHVGPCEKTELFHVVFLDQRQHEPYESNAIQAE